MIRKVTYKKAEYVLEVTVGVLTVKQGDTVIAAGIPTHPEYRELSDDVLAVMLVASAVAGFEQGVIEGKARAVKAVYDSMPYERALEALVDHARDRPHAERERVKKMIK